MNTDSVNSSSSFHYFLFWLFLGWGLIAVIVFLSLENKPVEIFEFVFADKLNHLFAYGMLMGWFSQLYPTMRQQLFWALTFIFLGVMIEFAQGWSGYRFFDVVDMLANACGVLLAWWLGRKWLTGSLLSLDHALSRLLKKS